MGQIQSDLKKITNEELNKIVVEVYYRFEDIDIDIITEMIIELYTEKLSELDDSVLYTFSKIITDNINLPFNNDLKNIVLGYLINKLKLFYKFQVLLKLIRTNIRENLDDNIKIKIGKIIELNNLLISDNIITINDLNIIEKKIYKLNFDLHKYFLSFKMLENGSPKKIINKLKLDNK